MFTVNVYAVNLGRLQREGYSVEANLSGYRVTHKGAVLTLDALPSRPEAWRWAQGHFDRRAA